MKQMTRLLFASLLAILFSLPVVAQVKVGGTPGSVHPAALLELEANNRGLLLPRLTTPQMINTSADAQAKGLLIYNTDSNRLFVYNGTTWRPVMYSSPIESWQLGGNGGTNAATQFIGTTDSVNLSIRTHNKQRLVVKANGLIGIGTNDPISAIDIVNNGGLDASDDINIRTYNNNAGPALLLYRARTTGTVPANLQNGDFLGILNFSGEVNGNNTGLSSIWAFYTGNGTTALSSLSFRTSGSQGMLLNDKGWLTIGNSSQSAGATADIQGSLRYKFSVPTSGSVYTVLNTDLVVSVTEGIGPSTILLPNNVDFDGHFIIIKNSKSTSVGILSGTGTLLCNGGGTGCGTLAALRVIGLVGQFVSGNMQWIQVF